MNFTTKPKLKEEQIQVFSFLGHVWFFQMWKLDPQSIQIFIRFSVILK